MKKSARRCGYENCVRLRIFFCNYVDELNFSFSRDADDGVIALQIEFKVRILYYFKLFLISEKQWCEINKVQPNFILFIFPVFLDFPSLAWYFNLIDKIVSRLRFFTTLRNKFARKTVCFNFRLANFKFNCGNVQKYVFFQVN